MSRHLADKVAIVTGSARGIGKAEAIALAREGAKVVINDLGCSVHGDGSTSGPADDVVAEIRGFGGIAVANYASVSASEGAESIIKTAIDNFGKLDILVNNAGIVAWHMIYNMTDEEWDRVVKVHLYGHFYCTRAACKVFRQQGNGGRIINTSSTGGLGMQRAVNYCASKEGVVGLTRAIALEMAKYKVTCNAIRPTATTRITQEAIVSSNDVNRLVDSKMVTDLASIKNLEDSLPEDIAPLVVFLASDEASNINGRVFFVRNGEVSLYPEPSPIKSFYKDGRWTPEELIRTLPSQIN